MEPIKGKREVEVMLRTVLGILAGLVMGLAGVFLFIWLLWWLWTRREEEQEASAIVLTAEPVPAEEPPMSEPERVEGTAATEEPLEELPVADDLKRIEGIGPKLSTVLGEAGIRTFAALADTDVDRLEKILEEADPRLLRLVNPSTWPEQAALASAGDWEALEALQNELKVGRRA
jgi:predicted flap endonuclease-1-like 5' DNA nuclease